MPLPPQSPISLPRQLTPPPSPSPPPPENNMSLPVKKKRFLNELIIKVPEVRANYRWEKQNVKVFRLENNVLMRKDIEKHMKNPNVCQLCETLFPNNTYLQKLNQNEKTLYCFNCIKFLSGKKNEDIQ